MEGLFQKKMLNGHMLEHIFNPSPQIEIGHVLPSSKLKYISPIIEIQPPFSKIEYCPAYPFL